MIRKIKKLVVSLNKYREFSEFQRSIHKNTYFEYESTIKSALLKHEQFEISETCSPIVERGNDLRSAVLKEFLNKYKATPSLKITVHVPPANISPAGFSIFSNLVDTFMYLGIECQRLEWNNNIGHHLKTFAPTVLISSDSDDYLRRLDWNLINNYKRNNELRVGLTASIEAYGNTPLHIRLKWAKKNGIDFYYSFRPFEYLEKRKDYSPFFEEGYKIHSIEFGANPLLYFPVDGIKKDLPYVFLGSSNSDKHERYIQWFFQIFKENPGFINGPGWKNMNSSINMNLNKYIYSRAKVGINLHIQDQILWANELNERTYTLAACGVPQLIDNPKLLPDRFSEGAMFKANTPKEYHDLFQHILCSPDEAQKRALLALEETYTKHTTFHRADYFIKQLGINK
jgi:hypothetical protein